MKLRVTVPDERMVEFRKLGDELALPYRDVLIMCAGIGLQYFRLAMHPPKELMRELVMDRRYMKLIKPGVEQELEPLKKSPRAKRVKK